MDYRIAKEYELFMQKAYRNHFVSELEAHAVFFQKLEMLELVYLLKQKSPDEYPEHLAKVKTNVAAALYLGVEQIVTPINNHSIPALIECLGKLKMARNSKDISAIIRVGILVFKEENIWEPCVAST